MNKCPQCEQSLIKPRCSNAYCENCGFPDENRCVFTLIEIKAYLRSMFEKQNCADDIRIENHRLACAYNLLTDEKYGIAGYCDSGQAENLDFESFEDARM